MGYTIYFSHDWSTQESPEAREPHWLGFGSQHYVVLRRSPEHCYGSCCLDYVLRKLRSAKPTNLGCNCCIPPTAKKMPPVHNYHRSSVFRSHSLDEVCGNLGTEIQGLATLVDVCVRLWRDKVCSVGTFTLKHSFGLQDKRASRDRAASDFRISRPGSLARGPLSKIECSRWYTV